MKTGAILMSLAFLAAACSDYAGNSDKDSGTDSGADTGGDPVGCGSFLEGRCGLEGQCIECITHLHCPGGTRVTRTADAGYLQCMTDEDCPFGYLCSDGVCMLAQYCSIYGECEPQCDPSVGLDCGDREMCVDWVCLPMCQGNQDCLDGAGTCMRRGYCEFQRCTDEGMCPDGTRPVAGTLVCEPEGS